MLNERRRIRTVDHQTRTPPHSNREFASTVERKRVGMPWQQAEGSQIDRSPDREDEREDRSINTNIHTIAQRLPIFASTHVLNAVSVSLRWGLISPPGFLGSNARRLGRRYGSIMRERGRFACVAMKHAAFGPLITAYLWLIAKTRRETNVDLTVSRNRMAA
jgi:hypothetical protein